MYIGGRTSPLNDPMKPSVRSLLKDQIYRPVFVHLIQKRWHAFFLIAFFTLFFILNFFKIEIWHCPVKTVLGIRCPGCGLGTAMLHLFRGEWWAMFDAHALAPFFLAGMILIAVITFLPEKIRNRTIQHVEVFERRTGFVTYYLFAFVLYWIIRIIFQM